MIILTLDIEHGLIMRKICQPIIISAAVNTGYRAQVSPYLVNGEIENAQTSTNNETTTGVSSLGFRMLLAFISISLFCYLTLEASRARQRVGLG